MTFEDFQNKFHISLTDQQIEAVLNTQGPSLLLAVPGSGKTTVLVTRLGYMVYCARIAPERILTLTYTVAATKDMAERFCSIFGDELRNRMEFRTINGICMRILYYFGRKTGKQMFPLLDKEDERKAILSQIYRQLTGEYATEGELQEMGARITYIKNMMFTEEEIHKLSEKADLPIEDIYRNYVKELRGRRQIDFDDQMIYAYKILQSYPEVLNYFQELYPYICVDEAQDTSRIQHAIIALLAKKTENLFMVGDEDQSIYGFRAAYPKALLDFEQDHPNAKILLLEQNFRSNASIVAAADRFIRKNELRHPKNMLPARDKGADIRNVSLKTRKAQYTWLSKVAADPGVQTAVLYRDNESAIPLIDLLERNGISYNVKSSDLSFFGHRIVADVTSILRFAMDPSDPELFMRIYYKIRLFFSRPMADTACRLAQEYGLPILEAVIRYGHLTPNQLKNCSTIQKGLAGILKGTAGDALFQIAGPLGYEEYLKRAQISDKKLFILRTLAAREDTPEHFLERLAVLQDTIRNKDNDPGCKFLLSTIHGSKGLEYDSVYLLDVIDGIFPETVPTSLKKLTKEERESWEEERRLFYVGITRAKEKLYLFTIDTSPSAFVKEVADGERIAAIKAKKGTEKDGRKAKAQATVTPLWKPEKVPAMRKTSFIDSYADTDVQEDKFRAFCDNLGEGMIVQHKLFGSGVITAMNERSVTILFSDNTEKKLGLKVLFLKELLQT